MGLSPSAFDGVVGISRTGSVAGRVTALWARTLCGPRLAALGHWETAPVQSRSGRPGSNRRTFSLARRRSTKLSYARVLLLRLPGRIRTGSLPFRKRSLVPIELRGESG